MVTPVVGTSVLGFGILYWFGFAKLLPALGYEIDSNPDELVDGSRVVIYNVGFLYPHGRLGCDFANTVGKTAKQDRPSAENFGIFGQNLQDEGPSARAIGYIHTSSLASRQFSPRNFYLVFSIVQSVQSQDRTRRTRGNLGADGTGYTWNSPEPCRTMVDSLDYRLDVSSCRVY